MLPYGNKLQCLPLLFSLIFVGKAESLPLERSEIRGSSSTALLTRVKNTLAYYDTATLKVVKSL
jgi:hypothetical protein